MVFFFFGLNKEKLGLQKKGLLQLLGAFVPKNSPINITYKKPITPFDTPHPNLIKKKNTICIIWAGLVIIMWGANKSKTNWARVHQQYFRTMLTIYLNLAFRSLVFIQ